MDRFAPCSICERHVRLDAVTCPFCGAPRAHCSASAASRWALHLSLVGALAGAGAACDKSGKARAPRGEETPSEDAPASTEKTDVGTPSGEGPESREDDPQGVESPDPRPAEPQRTLYGGPRMGAVDPAVDRGDTIDEPAVVEAPKEIYGGPRMDPEKVPEGSK